MTRRRVAEALWRIAGAPQPPLQPDEVVLLRAGGWVTELASEGPGRVILTNQRLLHVRQVVWPSWPRRPRSSYTSYIVLGQIRAIERIRDEAATRFRLHLVGIDGERWTVVSGKARAVAVELQKLGVPVLSPAEKPEK